MRAALQEIGNFLQDSSFVGKHLRSSNRSRMLRPVASQSVLTVQKRILRPQLSKLDLLDKDLTSFPNVETSLLIIDDYFPPRPVPLSVARPQNVTWLDRVHNKVRWRWRIAGLLHT